MTRSYRVGTAMLGDEAELADALTSGSSRTRCLARGIASDWSSGVAAWIEDELNNRNTTPGELLQALANLQMQIYASVAASMLNQKGIRCARDAYIRLLTEQMMAYAEIAEGERQRQIKTGGQAR